MLTRAAASLVVRQEAQDARVGNGTIPRRAPVSGVGAQSVQCLHATFRAQKHEARSERQMQEIRTSVPTVHEFARAMSLQNDRYVNFGEFYQLREYRHKKFIELWHLRLECRLTANAGHQGKLRGYGPILVARAPDGERLKQAAEKPAIEAGATPIPIWLAEMKIEAGVAFNPFVETYGVK
jgi:hypothetical protein